MEALHARCCVVGGGPAGMVLGFLLAGRRVLESRRAARTQLVAAEAAVS